MIRTITVYSTSACHLCEQAKALAWPVIEPLGWRLHEVDIVDDEQLMERYGIRIPVFALAGGEQELGWPFNQQQLYDWLIANSESQ